MSGPHTFIASSAFIRPSNLRFSTLLQTLAIARHVSKASGGRLIGFSAVREAEMQRLLNYMSVTIAEPRHMQALRVREDSTIVQLPRRILRDRASLLHESTGRNRGVGLREVAPLIGLDLDATMPKATAADTRPPRAQIATASREETATGDLLVADVALEADDEKTYAVDLKIEPRARVAERHFSHPQASDFSYEDQKQMDNHMFHFLSK